MKLLVILSLELGTGMFLAMAQPKGTVVQNAGDCSVNITGNNNTTASLICHGVDPKLAQQVRAILNGTWHNEKAIESLSKQLAAIQQELDKPTVQIQQHSEGPNSPNIVNINERPPSRRIPPEQRPSIMAILARQPAKIRVWAIGNNAEAFQFAQDWYDAFKSAGWTMMEDAVRTLLASGQPGRGIHVNFHGEIIPLGMRVEIPLNSPPGAILQSFVLLNMTNETADWQQDLSTPENEFSFLVWEHP